MAKNSKVIGLDGCAVREVNPRRVAALRSRLPSVGEASELADLFRLLGDVTRARMLFALLEAGELCVCDLAASVTAAETSVSHALRLLRTSGIVRARRDGRMVYYSLADAHVRLLLDISREHLRHDRDSREDEVGRVGSPRSASKSRHSTRSRVTRRGARTGRGKS